MGGGEGRLGDLRAGDWGRAHVMLLPGTRGYACLRTLGTLPPVVAEAPAAPITLQHPPSANTFTPWPLPHPAAPLTVRMLSCTRSRSAGLVSLALKPTPSQRAILSGLPFSSTFQAE